MPRRRLDDTDGLTKLMALRHLAGLTQQQVADKVGVQVSAISRWESSRNIPDTRRWADYASALQIPVKQLTEILLNNLQLDDLDPLPNALAK